MPLAAFVGACLGSFFNVCIYRIPREVSLSFPNSHCYRCGQPVRWYDNIPLLSYWILGGRCRDCGAPFSIRYFLVELLTMVLLLAATLKLGYTLTLIPAWIFTSMLIIGAFTDIDHWIIPDRITMGGIVVGLIFAAIPPIASAPSNPLTPFPGGVVWNLLDFAPRAWLPFFNAAAGAAAGWLILWLTRVIGTLVFKKEGMGMGDVKLFAMFGAFVGLGFLVPILMISSVIGTCVGLWMIVRGKVEKRAAVDPAAAPLDLDYETRLRLIEGMEGEERAAAAAALGKPGAVGMVRHHLPFGPSLAVAAYLVYFWGAGIVGLAMRWLESRTDFGF